MIAFVLVGLAVVIAITVVWSRVARGRSDSRSMHSYEHALNVLGDVTKRSDAAARIKPLSSQDQAAAHVRPSALEDDVQPLSAPPEPESATEPEPEVPLVHYERPKIAEVPTRFDDDSDAFERSRDEAEAELVVPFATAASAASGASVSTASHVASPLRPPRHPARERGAPVAWGRISSVAAVVLVVAALVLVGIHLAASPTKRHAAAVPPIHHHTAPPAHATTSTSTTPTTVPSTLVPVSTSPTDVAFTAPSGSYIVGLDVAGGVCWVGIQQVAGGPYVWEETLYSGQSASYKASGPLVIRIGAPKYLDVKINGLAAQLPAYVQPYDLTFNAA